MWIKDIGQKFFKKEASCCFGRRIISVWLSEWRLLLSALQNESKTIIRSCRMMCQAHCKNLAVNLSGLGALSGGSDRITFHTSCSVKHEER
jgi:hypothetical protein